jgi:protein farnesyltransferase/geranylgeranyltransferase type-1 subunit alpha
LFFGAHLQVRALVDRIGECGDQLITSAHILSDDSKNYHVWSHRQWLCQRFQAYDGELAFIDRLLAADIRNNSAWNHRFFVLEKTTGFTAEVIRSEIKFVVHKSLFFSFLC